MNGEENDIGVKGNRNDDDIGMKGIEKRMKCI